MPWAGIIMANFELLTMAQVAKILHVSRAHICNVVAGRVRDCHPIPAVRLGRRMLVRREALVAQIERNERAAANDNRPVAGNDNLKASPERGRKSA
jgi:plasmid maintenance system antidote protein VapI